MSERPAHYALPGLENVFALPVPPPILDCDESPPYDAGCTCKPVSTEQKVVALKRRELGKAERSE